MLTQEVYLYFYVISIIFTVVNTVVSVCCTALDVLVKISLLLYFLIVDDKFDKRESKRLSQEAGMTAMKWDKSSSKKVT